MGKFIGDGSGLTNLPSSIPSGGIILWSGSTTAVPSGWVLCDGANNTPNLVDRFVVGAGERWAVGSTGGSADAVVVSHSHTASTGSNGHHSHSGSTSSTGAHTHTKSRNNSTSGSSNLQTSGGGNQGTIRSADYAGNHSHTISTNATGSHTHTVSVDATGQSGTDKNLPPFYALAYIMKL